MRAWAVVALLAFIIGSATADAQVGCWGSLCQSRDGTVIMSKPISARSLVSLSTVPGALTIPGDLVLACTRATSITPGLQAGTLRLRPGTVPGTMALVIIVGTDGLEVTIKDNIPGGSC